MKRRKAPKGPKAPIYDQADYCVVCHKFNQLRQAHPLVYVCSEACHQKFIDGIAMLAEEAGVTLDEYMETWKAEAKANRQ